MEKIILKRLERPSIFLNKIFIHIQMTRYIPVLHVTLLKLVINLLKMTFSTEIECKKLKYIE